MAQDIAWRLEDARRRRGWSQAELARQSGVGIATVQRMEAGTFDPRLSTVRKLAIGLQVNPDWLLGGAQPMVWHWQMTWEEQGACQSGPEQAGLPGYVFEGPGPWYRDEDDEWQAGE